MEMDSSEVKVKSVIRDKFTLAADDVISFNVGGTIIAVLRSTLIVSLLELTDKENRRSTD